MTAENWAANLVAWRAEKMVGRSVGQTVDWMAVLRVGEKAVPTVVLKAARLVETRAALTAEH